MTKSALKYGIWSLGIAVGVFTAGTATAAAATTITSPRGGACYEGGSRLSIRWTANDLFHHHSYVSYGNATTPAPKHSQPSNIVGGQNTGSATTLVWQLPKVTNSQFTVYVASLSGINILNSASTTAPFSVDTSGPSRPILSVNSVMASSISLSWSKSSDPGCQALNGYKVYRNGKLLKTTTARSFTDRHVQPSTTYRYAVVAYDDFAATKSTSLAIQASAGVHQLASSTIDESPEGVATGTTTSSSGGVDKPADSTASKKKKIASSEVASQDTGLRAVQDSIILNNSSVQSTKPLPKDQPNVLMLAVTSLVLGAALLVASTGSVSRLQPGFAGIPQVAGAVRRKLDWRSGIRSKLVGGLLYATSQMKPIRRPERGRKTRRARRR